MSERERIEKMLADGKISREEAGRLSAALDKTRTPEKTSFLRRRIPLPYVFIAINVIGVAAVLWRVEAGRRGPAMQVTRQWPAEEASPQDVSEVAVEFDSVLDSATVANDSLRLEPAVRCRTGLKDPRTLALRLDEKLKGSTRYAVRISPSLRSRSLERAPAEPLWFETARLAVTGVHQSGWEAGDVCHLQFGFTEPVDPRELAEHLKISAPDGQPVGFERSSGPAVSSILVRLPRARWESVRVLVARGLAGTSGPLGLAADYETTVELSGQLRVLGVSADFEDGSPRIRVKTNAPVDIAAAAPFVAVEPPVKFSLGQGSEGLELVGDFDSGQRYAVTLKAGLSAGAIRPLEKDVRRSAWFPDRPAGVRFGGEGGYLSPAGLLKVPAVTTNVEKLDLTVDRLYASNLVEYVLTGEHLGGDRRDTRVLKKELAIKGPRNREVETLLDLRELAGQAPRGVYSLELREKDAWNGDSTIAVVTDLGLSARLWEGGALVWVTSIAAARPLEGVKVTVYSDRRQPLGSAVTDAAGLASVTLAPVPRGEAPALVVAEAGEDLSYLNLERGLRSRGSASASGREYLSRGYEVAAFAERGAYRPGDTVHLAGFVRGERWAVPPGIPLEAVLFKPGGKKLLSRVATSDAAGRVVLDAAVPVGAPTGDYRVEWRLPASEKALGTCYFAVADYIPQTLRMKLDAPAGRLPARDPFKVTAEVKHLFGDSAAGLPVRCRLRFSAEDFRPKGWDGYRFGDLRRSHGSTSLELPAGKLDAAGRAGFEVQPTTVESPAAVGVSAEVEVQEVGGRALAEELGRSLDPWPFYLGVKPEGDCPSAGKPALFRLAAVAPDGAGWKGPGREPAAAPVGYKASLYRVSWSSVLRRSGRRGHLEYESTRREELVTAAEGAFADGRAEARLTPDLSGSYRLVVESPGGCAACWDFYVTGHGGSWSAEDPEQLQLALDRPSYKPGETARLSVRAPFGGALLLCVESDRVIERRVVSLPAGGAGQFEFAVSESWRPNVHLTAAVVRAAGPEDEWRPHRASGAVPLLLDNSDRKIALELEAPAEVRPGADLELAVKARPGAAVVLAAVDEGVLALTGYRLRDPWAFFFDQRRLSVREFDMFSRLAPELLAWKTAKPPAPGGDRGRHRGGSLGAEIERRLNPVEARRVKTAVLYDGALIAGPDGFARAKFKVPEYIGELRVMAAAAEGDSFGSLSKALPVKSPLMCRASWPRFLAPGDEFDLPVTVFNRTAAGGRAALSLSFEGPLQSAGALPVEVEVPAGGEATVKLRLRASAVGPSTPLRALSERSESIGKAGARLTAQLGPEKFSEAVELAVRPAATFAHRGGTVVIEAGRETRVTVEGDYLPGTAKASLVLGGSPAVELSGALRYLLEYPYGCVEQTTSRMVPLIYLRDLAAVSAPESVGSEEIETLLEAGFTRLSMMQTHRGGLAYWPGHGDPYPWGSVYAADMLCEAKRAGHKVPPELLDPLMQYLKSGLEDWARAGEADGRPRDPGTAAYACYVLARAGQPPHAWLARLEERFRDEKSGRDAPATARFHLAAAMLAAGQGGAAKELVASARPTCELRESSGYLDSPVREAAVLLSTLLDLDPESEQVPALVDRLRRETRLGRWGTTQENAFALMALGKFARRAGLAADLSVTAVLPDGSERKVPVREGLRLTDIAPGQSVLVRAQGRGKLYAFWQSEGVPRDGAVKEEDSGLEVRREIRTVDGAAVVKPTELVQGRLYQVRLAVKSARNADNLVIVDLLPAGLEIENQELKGSAGVALGTAALADGWPSSTICPRHTERRDDRLILFADMWTGQGEYRYLVRAVTAGSFVLPPTEASCMYDPGIFSVNGRGRVEVKAQ